MIIFPSHLHQFQFNKFNQWIKFFVVVLLFNLFLGQTKVFSASFLTLADIHFDPFINCQHQDKNQCELIDLLEKTSEKKWQTIFNTINETPSALGRDTNFILLKKILIEAKKKSENNQIKFVLILGDLLAHEYKRQYYRYARHPNEVNYRLFVKKTFGFLDVFIKEYFVNENIYYVIGNNDFYKNYTVTPRDNFFKNIKLFGDAGYYAITLPDEKNIRLILLNTVLFSHKAKGKNIDTAAKKELDWLSQELIKANLSQQKVLISMHIPPNMDINLSDRIHLFTLLRLWQPIYKIQFQEILQNSPPVVLAIFAGHLHLDGLTYLKLGGGAKDVLVLQTTSVSPIFGNMPGFKLYRYQIDPVKLIDYSAYFLDKSGHLYEQHAKTTVFRQ
jgi:sphingomyelin phosphodiesterase acid-like 3